MPKQLSFRIEEIETFKDEYKLKPFVSTKLAVWKILPQVTHTDTTDTVSVTKAQGRVSIERVDEPKKNRKKPFMSHSANQQAPNIDGGHKKPNQNKKTWNNQKTINRVLGNSKVFSIIALIVISLYFPIKRHN